MFYFKIYIKPSWTVATFYEKKNKVYKSKRKKKTEISMQHTVLRIQTFILHRENKFLYTSIKDSFHFPLTFCIVFRVYKKKRKKKYLYHVLSALKIINNSG